MTLGILVGGVPPGSPNLDPISSLFQTKKCYFYTRFQTRPLKSTRVFRPDLWNPHAFSDQTSEIHTRFQTRPLKSTRVFRPGRSAEIMSSLLRLERKQKICSNAFRIRIFPFRSSSFGIETINTFIHSRSSLENHTRFQTKMGKVYIPVFRLKRPKRHIPKKLI